MIYKPSTEKTEFWKTRTPPPPPKKNLEASHEWGKNVILITTNGTYPWLFVTQLFRKLTSHCGHRKTYEEMTST